MKTMDNSDDMALSTQQSIWETNATHKQTQNHRLNFESVPVHTNTQKQTMEPNKTNERIKLKNNHQNCIYCSVNFWCDYYIKTMGIKENDIFSPCIL